MPGVPTKRLLVYLLAGLVVLGVGTGAVLSMRSGTAPAAAVTISAAGDGAGGAIGGASGSVPGAAVGDSTGLGGLDPAGAPPAPKTTTTTVPPIFVQVAGAVVRPGVYQMDADARVFQAVEKAGGFSPEADAQAVTLAARLTDGCRVYVPAEGEVVTGAAGPEGPAAPDVGGSPGGGSSSRPVSINSAGLEELDALPGIGPAIAQDIITYREANGPFSSVDQLTDVPGIGPSKLEQLRPLVTL